jgi:hypothetical protein
MLSNRRLKWSREKQGSLDSVTLHQGYLTFYALNFSLPPTVELDNQQLEL